MSDTPRTDAQVVKENQVGKWGNTAKISTNFARQLERELERMRIWGCRRDDEMQHQAKLAMGARAERDELQAEVARLRAGGCARDQKSTQFCVEAVALAKERDDWKSMAEQLEKELRGALNHGSSFLVNGRATTFCWNPEEGEKALGACAKLKGTK